MGFFFQEYIKKICYVPQPQQPITIWRVQKYAGHLNLLVLIYGFQCIAYQVSHKKVLPIYRFLYTGFFFQEYMKQIFDVPQPQQPITIWRVQKYARSLNLLVLIYGFQCIVYHVSHKRSYQSTASYIWILVYCVPGVMQKVLPIYRLLHMAFSVLSTRCHTKGPPNLQFLIYGIFLLVIHQEDLGCSLNHNSKSLFGQCRNMP